jgi:hypothetical protein
MASALIVFNDGSRLSNLQHAIACFHQQSWPYKECVIVNSTGVSLGEFPATRVIDIKAKFLGELKNLALYNALGEWCFPWPDDCEFAPDYINFHMHRRSKAFPTIISNPLGAVLKDGIAHSLDWEAAPFVSFFRFGPYTYDQEGSEVRLMSQYPDHNFVQAERGLATRFFDDYDA